MKVMENTQDRLVLDHRPVKLSISLAMVFLFVVSALLGLVFDHTIAVGLLILAISLAAMVPFLLNGEERTRLTLDRTTGKAYFRRRTLLGWKEEWHSLTDLDCAAIEKQTDRAGTLYRPVVSFKAASKMDQIALVKVFSEPKHAHPVVDAVNKWLDRPETLIRSAG